MSLPTKDEVKFILNIGLVSNNKNPLKETLFQKYTREAGEFLDVLAVAYGLKPLAALDFSSYGKTKFKKLNVILINHIIDYSNKMGVKSLHNMKTGGMYLKTIFYLPHNEQRALNLMAILWINPKYSSDSKLDAYYGHFYIGRSLGYSDKNIQAFLKHNFDASLSESQIKFINGKFDSDRFTLEELNKHFKIKINTPIKPLAIKK